LRGKSIAVWLELGICNVTSGLEWQRVGAAFVSPKIASPKIVSPKIASPNPPKPLADISYPYKKSLISPKVRGTKIDSA
jgi:hypothetical protein